MPTVPTVVFPPAASTPLPAADARSSVTCTVHDHVSFSVFPVSDTHLLAAAVAPPVRSVLSAGGEGTVSSVAGAAPAAV